MKKFLILSAVVAVTALTTSFVVKGVSDKQATDIQKTEGSVKAYRVTGDRVIVRKGPGKQYGQVQSCGRPYYVNKGDIMLPGYKGVKNGYRYVYEPGTEDDQNRYGWVSTQYLKATTWDGGYYY